MVTATGLGSGMDISGLVTQLVSAERAGADLQLTRDTNKINTKLSALGSLKGALSGFKASLTSLNSLQSFSKKTAISTDATAVSATSGDTAVPNTYSLEVSQLAASHSLASMSFAATDSVIGTGTLTFRFGSTAYNSNTDVYSGFTLDADSKVTTLTIDSSNNTLQGIMAAINTADFGVSASIVNAGDGYKLLIAGNETGLKKSLEITAGDGDGNNTNTGATAGLSNFAFNSAATNMTQTAAAKDANFSINGLAVSSSSNVAKDAIAGVDLTLRKLTDSPVTVTVKKDNSSAVAAMQSFVSGYNSFIKTLNGLTSYDSVKNKAGALLGDASVRSIKGQIDTMMRNEISGLVDGPVTLAEVGIKTGSDGQLTLSTSKFTELLNTMPDKLPAVFSAFGKPSDANISFKQASNDTAVGVYNVNITSLATSGQFGGSSVLPAFTPGNYLTLDANNSTFDIEVDGVPSGLLTLTAGEYQSGAALAEEMQARINGASNLVKAEVSVTVTYDASNNRFNIVSDSVGSTSTVDVLGVGTNVAAALGFSVQDGSPGLNVAGTIGGVAGTGSGDVLEAATTSAAKGLKLTIGGSTTGGRGSVNFTRGVMNQLDQFLDRILDTDGSLDDRIDNLNDRLKAVEDRRDSQEIRWTAVKERYLAQFNALDSLISKLNTTGSFLTSQLASLPGVVSKQ